MRRKPPVNHGSDNCNAILTEAQVLEIHQLWAAKKHRRTELAAMFGISTSTIGKILNGTHWAHIFPGKQGYSLHYGEDHVAHKLTEIAVRKIRQRLKQGQTGASLAREFGVSISVVSEIKNRKAWKHVT